MMYPFMTLDNNTEIVHSELFEDGRVKVYIETPDEKDGFHNVTCWLPDYTWEKINGYTNAEIDEFKKYVRNNAHIIMDYASKGGFANASNL